jgi:hypothetical protein
VETLVGVFKTINLNFGGFLTMELARNHVCSPLSPYILEEIEMDILQTNLLLFDDWKIIFPTAKIKKN